ncbi:MAG: hypothetical protein LBC41_02480 [Clostridiales bacterium]|jgi:hypothetical protein|nr:hypothetical protein [Clostridiales bacterium]
MGDPNIVVLRKFLGERTRCTIEWNRQTNVAEEYYYLSHPLRWEAIMSLNDDELIIVIPKGDPELYEKQRWLMPCIFKGKKIITANGSVTFVGVETNMGGWKGDLTVRVISGTL